jgi:hypothetical protein
VNDRDRLCHLEQRLAGIGADPCFTAGEIDAMVDGEVAKWCQIETDRLALLVALQTELHTRKRRG